MMLRYSSVLLRTHQRAHLLQPSHRYLSTNQNKGFTVGILRETYDKWERRAPLTPDHISSFLKDHRDVKVLVQPSSQRIFSDVQYQAAGATIQESLQDASVVLGVKRPKSLEGLPESSTCMFFSHVIKGQPENMDLLEDCLNKRVQLIDYECIHENHKEADTGKIKKKRLVGFGKYAGIAAMIDSFSILGRRLLGTYKTTTPFLNCPPSIYHPNLEAAKRSVQSLGERITTEGLPSNLDPIVVCITGTGGNVHSGVREILDLVPHEIVQVDDLPHLKPARHQMYVVTPEYHDLYRHTENGSFDRDDFSQHPQNYTSKFSNSIAPHIHVLMNCICWDERYPRLLTKDDMRRLYDLEQKRLLLISDISCDIFGSIEFLDRATTIDNPCYQYDPIVGRESSMGGADRGITMMGVDILPTELPVESSTHFGNGVSDMLDELVRTKEGVTVAAARLSPRLKNAMITTDKGKLSFKFQYLKSIMKRTNKQPKLQGSSSRSVTILIEGHLFDFGLINQVLDVLDANQCGFEFKECHVEHKTDKEVPVKSQAILCITGDDKTDFQKMESEIVTLISAIEKADASFRRIDENRQSLAYTSDQSDETVLLLGSGRVSKSVVDFLSRSKDRNIMVASNDEKEGREISALAKRGQHVALDAKRDTKRLGDLVRRSNVVISLLPASMHPQIAEMCIDNGTDLVTASYESNRMRELDQRAKDAGVRVLQECGLDPGLDHCSAQKIIDDIHFRGGQVVSFSSVCGGLPAPEAADNPLKYKFSWSPSGVINASQLPARYRWENQDVQIDGKELLQNAAPFIEAWPGLRLECLPNRDSLLYESVYGIECKTMFRGTLRYRGFSSLMSAFQNMGFFEELLSTDGAETWADVLEHLRVSRGGFESLYDFIEACAGDDMGEAVRVKECLDWLGMTGDAALQSVHLSAKDLFCQLLEEKLYYGENERDMILMHHAIGAKFGDGSTEEHYSSLQSFGDRSMSAMCKTVGYTAAAAADLVLNGTLEDRHGLLLPTEKKIYTPILENLKREGIVFEESHTVNMASQN